MPSGSHASAFADGAAYEATLGPAHVHYVRLKARLLDRVLRRRLPTGRRIVDLGCGTGQMEEALAGRGYAIVGVDLSPAMIEHANGKGIRDARFVAADAARTGLPPGAFDAAFATALWHHVKPQARAAVAAETARLVRPGGLVFVFEHNPRNPITRRVVRRSPVDADAVLLGPAETARHLEAAGLHVEGRRYLAFFPHPLAAVAGLEPWLGWCPAGGQYVVVARKNGAGGKGR